MRFPAVAMLALAALALVAFVAVRASAPAGSAAATVISEFERRAYVEDGDRSLDLSVILATPAYFRYTDQARAAERYAADRNVVVIVAEDMHYGDLPASPRPPLVLDGRSYAPTRADTLYEAPHHRVTALVYADASQPLVAPTVAAAELRFDGVSDMVWANPFGTAAAGAGPGLSIPLILALLGGMLASMWPCLFQLTAYFLPSVAGLSLDEARSGRADGAVLRTAVLFVSGIVIVYTLAGLVAGFAAQSVSGAALFNAARQPIAFVAGLVIIGMAIRLALRAKRPLVCKMPTTAPRPTSGLGTVALGLAFATGCMTCFGAAVVLGMFTYVVTNATPLAGAAILFVFSLGIAVPLVFAAMAMARVLPLLGRLERFTPALTVLSATIMAGYGALLLSGSSHVISDTISRVVGTLQ